MHAKHRDDPVLARLAVEGGHVDAAAMQECLRELEARRVDGEQIELDRLLLSRGLIDEKALAELQREERRRRYHSGAVPSGLAAEVAELLHNTNTLDLPRFRRYEILERLGEGGVAIVYRALDRELRREVALKVLRPRAKSYEELRQRFYRESLAAARLSHPNLVTLYDACEEDGNMYLVMELIKGRPLSDLVPESRKAPRAMVALLEKVARAVHYAHEHGIVHRDLKPGNIIVTGMGEPKVADFSLAWLLEAGPRVTETGLVVGTPPYMAPEQVQGGAEQISARTDVYALGAILYEILVGRPPHTAASPVEVLSMIVSQEPDPPHVHNRRVAPDLETICLKALEKNPARRYATAAAFAEDLRRYLAGEPIHARPPGPLQHLVRRLVAHRLLLVPAVAALIAVAAVVWGILRTGAAERNLQTQQKIRPLEALIRETRPYFYVEGQQIEQQLNKVEQAISGVEAIARDPAAGFTADAWIAAGMGWYFVGDLDRAEAALRKAQATAPDDGRVNFYLGRIYLEQALSAMLGSAGDPTSGEARSRELTERAAQHLSRPVRKWEGAEDIDRHLAGAYRALAAGQRDEVVRLCSDGLERFKKGTFGREEYHLLRGWVTGEISDYTEALRLRPHYPWAHFMRGNAQVMRGVATEAIKDYTAALSINPRLVAAYNNRGNARCQMGDAGGAIEDFNEFMRLRPNDATIYVNRANARRMLGDNRGALEDCSAAIRLDPRTVMAYVNRGNARQQLGDPQGALEDYSEALRIDPRCVLAYMNRGEFRRNHNELDAAIDDFTRAIELAPDNPSIYARRALAREAKDDRAGALDDYGQAVRLAPREWEPLARRADLRLQTGDLVGALQDFDRALELNPHAWLCWLNRGVTKMASRDLPGAKADFDQAIRLEPQRPEGYYNRATLRRMRGNLGGALVDLKSCLDVAPADWPQRETVKSEMELLRRQLPP